MTPADDLPDALFEELERRLAEHLSGKDPGVPAEEFFRDLRRERGRGEPNGSPPEGQK